MSDKIEATAALLGVLADLTKAVHELSHQVRTLGHRLDLMRVAMSEIHDEVAQHRCPLIGRDEDEIAALVH